MRTSTHFVYYLSLLTIVWAASNDRPIIGILTQPSYSDITQFGEQFLAASYVKFIEGAGARVAPILYGTPPSDLKALFGALNGVLFPGGGVDFHSQHPYVQTITSLYQMATQANQNGDHFPIWGTCMGFQEICMLQSGNWSLLSSYDSENYTIPLNFTSLAQSSRLIGSAPRDIQHALATQPITLNNHHYGVSPASFAKQSDLYSFFNVLSTNVDRGGNIFLSTIEGKEQPVYATQWHPEKPPYEWNAHEATDHSYTSILANQYTANFFVNEARKNHHKFSSAQAETDALIYRYKPVYIYDIENDFEQGYFFNITSLPRQRASIGL